MVLLGTFIAPFAMGQNVPCSQISFESGGFGAWLGKTGSVNSAGTVNLPNTGIVNGRHTIMTPGIDPNVGIATVPPGATHSVRLGNSQSGRQAESLELTFNVTAAQSTFQYQYAVVLEDPSHQSHQQPGLEFKLFDAAGNTIPCSEVRFVSGAGIPGFKTKTVGFRLIRYKDWETVAIDLVPYIGQQITIRFTVNDCTLGAHYGYSYITAACVPETISITPFCVGDASVTISAPLGYSSYLWSNGATTSSIVVNSPNPGDLYSVQLKSVSGCETQAAVTIPPASPVPPDPVPVIKAPACGGDLQLEVNPGANSYRWYATATATTPIDGATSNVYNPPFTTTNVTYYVTAVNTAGCESGRVAVTGQVLPTPSAPAMIGATICVNQTATLTVNETNSNTYNWYKDVTGGTPFQSATTKTFTTIALTADTTFYVSQVAANGCESDRQAVQVTVTPAPTLSISNDKGCLGETTTLIVSGNVPNGKYQWYDASNTLIVGATDSTYTTPVLGANTTYYVTAENATGCISAPFTVATQLENTPAAPNVPTIQVCSGETATLTVNETNTFTYNWYTVATGGTAINSSANKTFTTSALTANVTYYVSQQTSAGCEGARTAVNVTVNPLPAIPTVVSNKGCLGERVTLQAGGSPTGQYRWYTSNNAADVITGETSASFLTPALTQNTTYYVATVSASGCASTLTPIQADAKPTPAAPAWTATEVCESGEIVITIQETTNHTYRWYADSTSTTAFLETTDKSFTTPTLTTTTTYYLAQLSANGCEGPRALVQAVVNPLPSAPQVTANEGCEGNSVSLQVSGAIDGQYRWYQDEQKTSPITGEVNGTLQTPTLTSNAVYYVNIVDAKGCESAVTKVEAIVHPLPEPFTKRDTTVCLETLGSLVLDGGVHAQYLWSTGETTREIAITEPGTYRLQMQNEFGCQLTDSIKVKALCAPVVYIPDAFSPNGDGNSDLFKVFGRYLAKIDIMVYNRWGTLVFMANDLNKGWDGQVNGELANGGVFRCKVIYTGENGEKGQKQAMIHLVR
ncbi:hypothetical protein BKI52_20515 [marine bacterium AO1-C]|nr:hypothetical protein BKI52_20515 [marine bacterium AO1-C]